MDIKIYQVIYSKSLDIMKGVDSTINNLDSNPKYRELPAFLNFVQDKKYTLSSYSGILSPAFQNKTKISVKKLKNIIRNNPGYDVYIVHPYRREIELADHFMQLAELEHPGISKLINLLWLEFYGENSPRINLPDHSEYCLHCNYFVANKEFWDEFGFLLNYFWANICHLGGERSVPYNLSRTSDLELPIAVFAFERLFTHFLFFKCEKYSLFNIGVEYNMRFPEVFDGESLLIENLKKHIRSDKKTWLEIYYAFRKMHFRKGD